MALDDIIMTPRGADDGTWLVVGSDGSIREGPFVSRGAARRYIENRADLSDVEMRSMVTRCTPAQRRELRATLDDLDGA